MHADIAALDLQVGPFGRGQQVFPGAGTQAGVGAGDRHFLVGGRRGLAALALQTDLATGGVEVDAGFAVGFAPVADLTHREDAQAIFDGQAVVALGDQVAVLAAGDAEAFAGNQNVAFRGELADAAGCRELQTRFAPGGNAAGAALGGFDFAFTAADGATAGRGVHDFDGVLVGFGDGKFVGGRIAFEGGVLFGGNLGQALRQALRSFALGDRFAAVELVAAGPRPGVGADQQPAAGAQRGGGPGGEFGAVAAVLLAGVVALLFEVAELELALVFGGGEFDARFAGGVVEDELVVAALPAAAAVELLGLETGEAGAVGVFARLAGEEGGGVGAGLLGAAADLVALGVGLALAVVGGADDDGAVDITVLKGDDDFLARARGEVAAPVGAGDRGHDAQPDAEAVAGRGIVATGGVFAASGRLAAALPGELDADAQVAVGMGRGAGAEDDGG